MSAGGRTLFERIGGEPAVDGLLEVFYERVLADPELAPFFENTSMEKLRSLQRAFFAAALDGPVSYDGPSLREVHAGRGIGMRHLARFVDHLLASLREHHIGRRDAVEIVDRISAYADQVTDEAPGRD